MNSQRSRQNTIPLAVFITDSKAPENWGNNALLSFSEETITIHYQSSNKLTSIQQAGRKIDGLGISSVRLEGDNWDVESCWHFWCGYRNAKNTTQISLPTLTKQDEKSFKLRFNIIDWCRDVINMPAENLGPIELAQQSATLISQYSDKVSYNLISGESLKEQNHLGIYTVGKGSKRPAALLELDYNPSQNSETPVTTCIVGKGVTFDSGGYSLKPTGFMESMRADMGGAALAASALALAIAEGLDQRIKLYLCCADNLVSGDAFKLGDIIRYQNGISVEVNNTDAEGRLVLADGLICANNDRPKYIIDCATLTGAAKMAVGNDYHAFLTFDPKLAQKLMASSIKTQEAFWQLPLAEFHRKQFPSSFADISNSGMANTAGASTAAAFLSYFVKNYQKNWLHIDCSATFYKSASSLWATGATGIGVKALANLLCDLKK